MIIPSGNTEKIKKVGILKNCFTSQFMLLSCLKNKTHLLQLRHLLAVRQLLIVLLLDASASIGAGCVQVILVTATANAEPARKSRQRLTGRFLILDIGTGHGCGGISSPFIEGQVLFGLVEG